MLKTIASQIKEFKRDSILTPLFMLAEVATEMVIPLLMASIIDKGVEAGDLGHIQRTGLWMLLIAVHCKPPVSRFPASDPPSVFGSQSFRTDALPAQANLPQDTRHCRS